MRVLTLPLQLQFNSRPMLFRIFMIQNTTEGFCDFLCQCILVCINQYTCHPFYWPKSSKIYRCWILCSQNIRVVIIPSFLAIGYLGQSSYPHLISWFQFITSSYLASDRWSNNNCTRPLANCFWDCWLGVHDDYNRSRQVHGRECPGDRFDRFQDPQGVLGS